MGCAAVRESRTRLPLLQPLTTRGTPSLFVPWAARQLQGLSVPSSSGKSLQPSCLIICRECSKTFSPLFLGEVSSTMQSLLVTLPLASFSPLVTAQPLLALSRAAQTRSLDRHLLPVASAETSTASMSPTRKILRGDCASEAANRHFAPGGSVGSFRPTMLP